MLLKANKYRKDKKADCRQNELGSRIFMGRVFGDYAECLHFYPSFSYGRIIAGERHWHFSAPMPVTAARSADCHGGCGILRLALIIGLRMCFGAILCKNTRHPRVYKAFGGRRHT